MALLSRLEGALLLSVFLAGAALAVEGDVVFEREGQASGFPPTVFPHWTHRIRFKCYACHPTIFEMKAGANEVSMDAIQAGEYCGVCHNGTTAWAVDVQTCNRCHRGE